jgi:hypothetical protein
LCLPAQYQKGKRFRKYAMPDLMRQGQVNDLPLFLLRGG